MKKIKLIKGKGILFWVTGLSGSGKTSIAKLLKKDIEKLYGKTVVLSGDDLRKCFNLFKFDKKSRFENGQKFIKLCKILTNQKINVILAIVGMDKNLRKLNKTKFKNYVEIYIKSDLGKIKKIGKKKIYQNFKTDIVGLDIKPELPKEAHIKINNDFKYSIEVLKNKILKKMNRFEYK